MKNLNELDFKIDIKLIPIFFYNKIHYFKF